MVLEYYGVSKENLKSGISMTVSAATRAKHIKAISSGSASNMLEWVSLPDMSEKEHIEYYLEKGYSKKDAIKIVAEERGVSKNSLYKYTIEKEQD